MPGSKTLLLSQGIDDAQKTFIYAKEIAYNYLDIKDRLYTFSWIKFDNFDQVLNNFYASYFAGALVIPRKQLTNDLKLIFSKPKFQIEDFKQLLNNYNASAESVFQRLTNILPKDFNLKSLFFLRFSHKKDSERFDLNKELHLSKQQSPHANETNEHYCRRWISLKVLNQLITSKDDLICDVQVSNYSEESSSYLVFSAATQDPFKSETFRSVSVGIQLNTQTKKKIKFTEDNSILNTQVGVTCERCSISDCKVRQAEPTYLNALVKDQKISETVNALQEKFSK